GGTQGSFLPWLSRDDAGGVFVTRTYRDRLHQSIALTRLTSSGGYAQGWNTGVYAGTDSPWEYPSQLCSDGGGGVFVAFQENQVPPRILIDRFDGLGTKAFGGRAVSSTPLDQTAPGLVNDGDRGAIALWEDHRNGVFDQLYAQRMLSDGSIA